MRKMENRLFDNGNLKFKEALSNIELAGIEHILGNMFNAWREGLLDEGEGFLPCKIEEYGLAYTSSSAYAMYNVTNEIDIAYINDMPITLSHIAITENDMLVFVGYDVYEHAHYYEIEINDFY